MHAVAPLERIRQAMSDPGFYPHPVSGIDVRETHISLVFLTGDWVYKLKKPRNLGFLDFRTLKDRKRFCHEEVRLNQRLSRGVYHDVVAIRGNESGHLSMTGRGTVLEYAVRMRQLPDQSSLATLLEASAVTDKHITDLGRALALFHAQAERGPDIDVFGHPGVIRTNMEENFEQIEPLVPGRLDLDDWDFLREVWRACWKNHQDLFRRRVEAGRIRDGHGDLRAEHVYFDAGVQIIDCIEFNQRFRYGDVALDLAFLLMDLDRRGHGDVRRRLLAAYARHSNDPEMYALLDFYAAYRAVVRLKVAGLSLDQTDATGQAGLIRDMRAHLRLACLYAFCFGRPALWIFCGLPASGKSTLAESVTSALNMPLLQSDALRRPDATPVSGAAVPFNTGQYRPVLRDRVYAKMLNLAHEHLKSGHGVALDATFSASRWRQAAVDLACETEAGLVFVECVCAAETIKDRLAARESSPSMSNARLMHFEDLRKAHTPFADHLRPALVRIDTDQPLHASLFETLDQAHAIIRRQAEELLAGLENGSDKLA